MPENETTSKRTYAKSVIGKRVARITAVQVLYAMSIEGVDQGIDETIHQVLHLNNSDYSDTNEIDESLVIRLARGAYEQREVLIEALQEFLAQDWRFKRLAKPVQSIFLAAAYEIKFIRGAEPVIIINEYLEVAKLFNHEGEVGFINSVLDGFYKKFAQ